MSYLWLPPLRITVKTDGQYLTHILWNERTHGILRVARRWRVDIGWWQTRIWRDYYKIVTHTGLLMVVYQDLGNKQWYVQQVYD
ncbi:MAG: hypothetical protein AAFQ07_09980 [Chloroflexota bacterium]